MQSAGDSFRSSLRATGSRECAPDDRLREAIHFSIRGRMDCSSLSLPCANASRLSQAMTVEKFSAPPRQPPHHFVELFQVAVADLDAAAGIAVMNGDGETERVADAFFQRQRIRILDLAAACFLRLALGHALVMRQGFRLTDVETFGDDALGGSE